MPNLIDLGRVRIDDVKPGGQVDPLGELEHDIVQDFHPLPVVLELEI